MEKGIERDCLPRRNKPRCTPYTGRREDKIQLHLPVAEALTNGHGTPPAQRPQ